MTSWKFRDYVTHLGRNPFGDWLKEQPPEVGHGLRNALLILRAEPDWEHKDCPYYKALDPPHAPLGEVIFEAPSIRPGKRRQFRAIGLLVESEHDGGHFLFLEGCEKVGGDRFPLGAFDDGRNKHFVAYEKGLGTYIERRII